MPQVIRQDRKTKLWTKGTQAAEILGFKTMPDEKENQQFFGVELEIVTPSFRYDNLWDQITFQVEQDLDGEATLQEEGLPRAGCEIVTAPATLNYHRQQLWNKFFDNSSKLVESPVGCGIHIHFSVAPLTSLQLAKIIYFYHNTDNVAFIEKIAARKYSGNMEKKKLDSEGEVNNVINSVKVGTIQMGDTGYIHRVGRSIISISQHMQAKTCEVRMFQGQTTRHGVMRALEFVDAVIQFCKATPNMGSKLTDKEFLSWFPSVTDKYPDLSQNLVNLKLINSEVK